LVFSIKFIATEKASRNAYLSANSDR